ncbi:MAG: mechanosensitive ion channel family protein [Bacillota bacterium]|nr:mechanosensitive ion channel family protein [Bacillota bacterium]
MPESLLQFWQAAVARENIWWQLGTAGFIVLLAFLARGLFTFFIFRTILRMAEKTKTAIDEAILLAFENPLKKLILVIGFYIALLSLPLGPAVDAVIGNIFRSLLIVFIAAGFYNLVGGDAYHKLSEKLSVEKTVAGFATKALRFIIIALAVAIIAQEWDYDVNGFIAGLGLGGLAVALAAKDALANIFGGLVILLDKPFAVGDWISSPSVEGTVEEMGFRSTRVRTFANAQVTVPNASLANDPITNWTRMQKRRISFHLGVTYNTSRQKLQRCIDRIRTMLARHPKVHPETIFACFDEFNDSSLDIFIYFFTKTTEWGKHLAVKEEINFKIMAILEEEGVSVAFPSQSVYFENRLAVTEDPRDHQGQDKNTVDKKE